MINIYCDESCHLEHDNSKVMLLGAISCEKECVKIINDEIRKIKMDHKISPWREIKWTNVSKSQQLFYVEIIKYFFSNEKLNFRAVLIPNKADLNHAKYNGGDHNLWYYKSYFYLLDPLIGYNDCYNVFVDVKDTQGGPRLRKLKEVLSNNIYDFRGEVIKDISQIRSQDSEILQIVDLLIGGLSYYHNGLHNRENSNSGKNILVDLLMDYMGESFKFGNQRGKEKVDIFMFRVRSSL